MPKAFTLHAIQVLEAEGRVNEQTGRIVVPAKIKTIPPGRVVDLDADTVRDLLANEAVRLPTNDEIAIEKARSEEAQAETRPAKATR